MAIEIPNAFEAGGSFDGRVPPDQGPFGPIISSNGILPLDPTTTPAAPKGGFTRGFIGFPPVPADSRPGAYIIGLERPVDGAEAIVLCNFIAGSAQLGVAPFTTGVPAPVVGAIIVDDGFVQIMDSTHNNTVETPNVNFGFYLGLFRIQTGPNVTPNA